MTTSLQSSLDQSDDIKYDLYLTGLTPETVRQISLAQKEPARMLEHRLTSLETFFATPLPTRGPDLSTFRFEDIVWYARPKKGYEGYAKKREEVPEELKDKFQKLGIPAAEQKYLAGAGGQMDSESVYHKIKEKRAQKGVIFADMPEALQKHENLVKKYFMRLVPATDHKFAALHGAVRSGGTFIYVPKGVQVTEPLQAYFRMNTYGGGQFEHTLIVLDDDTQAQYIEGCSAPKYDTPSLHAGLVEVFVGKRAKMKYASVENWSTNTYNLNTKRALVAEDGYIERVGGNMGSCVTMLYPCSVLQGDRSKSDAISIAVAGKGQNQDVGSKVIHIGKQTSSTIISKSISKDGGVCTYRGLVDMLPSAIGGMNQTTCDALLLDDRSVATAIPDIRTGNEEASVAHEASAGKVDEYKIFYLTSRGITKERAVAMIVNGFFSPIVKKLPLEYAGEFNRLIEMEMEGSVG